MASIPATSSYSKLKWVDRISRLMDSKFIFPGTKFRFGIDPFLGLIPGAGDLGSYAVSLALIHAMYKHGASGLLITKMLFNASLDAVIGTVPLLGALFDFWFKANTRNVQLLREYHEEGKHQGSGKSLIALIITVAVLIMAGLIYLTVITLLAVLDFVF